MWLYCCKKDIRTYRLWPRTASMYRLLEQTHCRAWFEEVHQPMRWGRLWGPFPESNIYSKTSNSWTQDLCMHNIAGNISWSCYLSGFMTELLNIETVGTRVPECFRSSQSLVPLYPAFMVGIVNFSPPYMDLQDGVDLEVKTFRNKVGEKEAWGDQCPCLPDHHTRSCTRKLECNSSQVRKSKAVCTQRH